MKKVDYLFIFAIIVLIVSLSLLAVTLNKFTGYATGTGYANLSVEAAVAINFTTSSIDWGSGKVTQGQTSATLSSVGGERVNGNWTQVYSGLVLENIGNVNVTLDLQAAKSAATFIGGTNPAYKWKVSNNETGSCSAGAEPLNTFVNVNTTAPGRYCGNFSFAQSTNQILIDINITIPENSLKGALGDTITATATAA